MGIPALPHPLRLNLGAGDKVVEGFVSVGLGDHHDIRTDVRTLPLPDHCADEAMAIHVLEHLNRWEVPDVLREWRRVLKPGGLLVLELPDVMKCARNLLANAKDSRNGMWGLYGDPGYRDELMVHRWGWRQSELMDELKAAGFGKVKSRDPLFHGRRRHRDMRIEARA